MTTVGVVKIAIVEKGGIEKRKESVRMTDPNQTQTTQGHHFLIQYHQRELHLLNLTFTVALRVEFVAVEVLFL